MEKFYEVLRKTDYNLRKIAKVVNWSASAAFAFGTELPYQRDILGIIFELTGQVDSGTGVTKAVDNLMQIIAQLKIKGDGEELIDLYDYEILWFSWYMCGFKPEIRETPDETGQSNQAVYARFIIPCGIKKGAYKKVTVDGTWGAIADLDSGASFNVDSATLDATVILGSGVKKEIYTKQHSNTVNGDDEHTAPKGNLLGIMLQTSDRSDSIDTIELEVDGNKVVQSDFECIRAFNTQVHEIDYQWRADVDAERTTGICFIDGGSRYSNGANIFIRYKTTASKTVYCKYIFTREPKLQSG